MQFKALIIRWNLLIDGNGTTGNSGIQGVCRFWLCETGWVTVPLTQTERAVFGRTQVV